MCLNFTLFLLSSTSVHVVVMLSVNKLYCQLSLKLKKRLLIHIVHTYTTIGVVESVLEDSTLVSVPILVPILVPIPILHRYRCIPPLMMKCAIIHIKKNHFIN